MAFSKTKPVVEIATPTPPTLLERIAALHEVIDALHEKIDALVAEYVEDSAVPGVPTPVIEQLIKARATGGYCRCWMPAILEKDRLAANLS